MGKRTRNAAVTREATRVAIREWPPNSKKLSCSPTRSTPRASRQMFAKTFSVSVTGGAKSAGFDDWRSGLGKALRSTLPFGVSGKSVQSDESRRHHVVRQLCPKQAAQL